MCIIHESYLQHTARGAPSASHETLDFEIGHDPGCEARPWITVSPTAELGRSAVLEPQVPEDRILNYLRSVHESGASIAG